MTSHTEKRRDGRVACSVRLEWAPLSAADEHAATLTNFSQGGLGLESRRALPKRSTIRIRMDAHTAPCRAACGGGECPWPRSVAVGEVVWCRERPGGQGARFAAGVRFLHID
jgi:hypothetical protein